MTDLAKDKVELDNLWSRLSDVLRASLGLHFPRERVTDLKRGITAAASAFGLKTAEDCARRLLSSPMSPEQIEIVARCLTVGETYFFRDPRSFDILKEEVLLPYLNARQGVNQHLRIWSAACCSGEEPYSIAMLLKKVIPNIRDWMITILATDINLQFLQKGEEGVYSHWSFRGMPDGIMESFFSEIQPGQFAIAPQIKNMVTFEPLNLVKENYPSIANGYYAMDIIFCRNVLMYFEPEQAYKVIQRLSQTLVDGGWLFLSPCDVPPNMTLPELNTLKFGDYIVYQKESTHDAHQDDSVKRPALKLSRAPTQSHPSGKHQIKTQQNSILSISSGHLSADVPPLVRGIQGSRAEHGSLDSAACKYPAISEGYEKSTQTILQEATLLLNQGAYDQALNTVMCCMENNPSCVALMIFLGKIHANLGQLRDARNWCEQALALDPVNSACCNLYATILQEQGLDLDATVVLRRALYLEQNNPVVHYFLGNVYRRQDNLKEANRHYQNALNLLKGHALDEEVMGSDGMNVGRLTALIESAIDVGVRK